MVAAALAPYAGAAPIEQLAVGFSFEVLATDRLVFRVPRTSSAADRLAAERPLLAFLADRLPVEVPSELVPIKPARGLPFGARAERRLRGTPPDDEHLTPRLATQIGRALATLHELSAVDAAAARIPSQEERWDTLRAARAATAPILRDLLPAHECSRALTAWDALLDKTLNVPTPAVVVHGDAWHGNVLVAVGRLAAIIDWERGGLGDRAEALALALHAGESFAHALWRGYGDIDDQLHRRIQLWWRGLRELGGFLPAAEANDHDELAQCIAKLRRSQLLTA